MNVTVENLAPCKKLVRIEVDAVAVDTAFATMEKSFQKEANIPGFRVGKAPIPMVLKKHGDAIKEEVKRNLRPHCLKNSARWAIPTSRKSNSHAVNR